MIYSDGAVAIVPLEYSDLETLKGWYNSLERTTYSGEGRTAYQPDILWHEITTGAKVVWAIHIDEHFVGIILYKHIDWIYRRAEIDIMIGEVGYCRKGVGTQVVKWVIEHGFKRLNLHRVHSRCAATHQAIIRLNEKINVPCEGCAKEALYLDGVWVDQLYYGITQKAWYKWEDKT
jgi:RimJ/RimL family protein N-acetyltransferase